MARRPRLLLGAVLALSLTACSAAGPATSEDGPVTSRAGASSAPAPPPGR
ncbi:hypothetical protein [Arthrobacter sp. RIT-PI-e]|nr:hypothetical protein [Arthrobacter sp. RIT-PI-e]